MTTDNPDKQVQITVYTTLARREELKAYAKEAGHSLSEWLLYAAAGEMNRADAAQIEAERARLARVASGLREVAQGLRNDLEGQKADALLEEVIRDGTAETVLGAGHEWADRLHAGSGG